MQQMQICVMRMKNEYIQSLNRIKTETSVVYTVFLVSVLRTLLVPI